MLKKLADNLLDIFYPRFCLLCRTNLQGSNGTYLCPDCAGQIKPIKETDVCFKCGESLGPHIGTKKRCLGCQTRPLKFTRAIGAARYNDVLRSLIHKYKYGGEKFLADLLADLLKAKLETEKDLLREIDLLMPVPLHPSRFRERGFNQAELLARRLGRSLARPLIINNLCRIKKLAPQSTLSRSERLNNLREAFAVKHPHQLKNKTVLLIDDVMTTGTTASEIAGVLKKAGAKKVYVAIVGR